MTEVVAAPPSKIVSAGREKIALGLSSYKSMCPVTAVSLMALFSRRKLTLLLSQGDAFISHSRNTVVEKFLDTDCEWLFSVDDDVILPFGDANWFRNFSGFNTPEPFASFNVIDRLLSHGKMLIGGVYFGREKHGSPMYGEGKNPAEAAFARSGPHNTIKQTRWCATGCLLVHRQVFLDIEAKFPRLSRARNNGRFHGYTATEHGLLDGIERIRNVLSEGPQTGEKSLRAYQMIEALLAESHHNSALGTGEDVQFCIRAAQAGHQCFVDHGIHLGHVGTEVFGAHNTSIKPK